MSRLTFISLFSAIVSVVAYGAVQPIQTLPGYLPGGIHAPIQTLPGQLPGGIHAPIQTLPGQLPGGIHAPIQTLPGQLPGGIHAPIQTLPGQLPGGIHAPIQTLPGQLPGGIHAPIQTLPGQLPGGAKIPIQTLPAVRQTIHSRIGVLLIRDQVTGSDYVTTLDSSATSSLPGSQPQAIFGARMPGQGARKAATWYTQRADSKVLRMEDFTPRQAFMGMTDEHGHSSGLNGDVFIPQWAQQVNPVLSGKAFNELVQMPVGSSHELGVTEVLQNGSRQFIANVYKRAQLELGAAAPQCKDSVVDGVHGKVCTLRTIHGASKAQQGGDVLFSVEMRARLATPHARFKVGAGWHPLGQRIPVAEFANAKDIELFFVPPPSMAARERLSDLVNVSFSSASRSARGDHFSVRLRNAGFTPPKSQVLSRLSLLTVSDEVNQQHGVMTLQGSEHQRLAGSDYSANNQPAWYLQATGVQPLYPVVKLARVEPQGWFSGEARIAGQLAPVLSSAGMVALSQLSPGGQQLLTAVGERQDGSKVTYLANVNKQAGLTLSAASGPLCVADRVNGIPGMRCTLRQLHGVGLAMASNVRLSVRANQPLIDGQYYAGNSWHLLSDEVPLATLMGQRNLDVFYVPRAMMARGMTSAKPTGPHFELALHDQSWHGRPLTLALGGVDTTHMAGPDKPAQQGAVLIDNHISDERWLWQPSGSLVKGAGTSQQGQLIKLPPDRTLATGMTQVTLDKVAATACKIVQVNGVRGVSCPLYRISVTGQQVTPLALQLQTDLQRQGLRYRLDDSQWLALNEPLQLAHQPIKGVVNLFNPAGMEQGEFRTRLELGQSSIYAFSQRQSQKQDNLTVRVAAQSVLLSGLQSPEAGFVQFVFSDYIMMKWRRLSIEPNYEMDEKGGHLTKSIRLEYLPKGVAPDEEKWVSTHENSSPSGSDYDMPIGVNSVIVHFKGSNFLHNGAGTLNYGVGYQNHPYRVNVQYVGPSDADKPDSYGAELLKDFKLSNGMVVSPGQTLKYTFMLPTLRDDTHDVYLSCRRGNTGWSAPVKYTVTVDGKRIMTTDLTDFQKFPDWSTLTPIATPNIYNKKYAGKTGYVTLILNDDYPLDTVATECGLENNTDMSNRTYEGAMAYVVKNSPDSKMSGSLSNNVAAGDDNDRDTIGFTPAIKNNPLAAVMLQLDDASKWINSFTAQVGGHDFAITSEHATVVPLPEGADTVHLHYKVADPGERNHNYPFKLKATFQGSHGVQTEEWPVNVITADSDNAVQDLTGPKSIMANEQLVITGKLAHPAKTQSLWLNIGTADATGSMITPGALTFDNAPSNPINLVLGQNDPIHIPKGAASFQIVATAKPVKSPGTLSYRAGLAEGATDTGSYRKIKVQVYSAQVAQVGSDSQVEGTVLHSQITAKDGFGPNSIDVKLGVDRTDFTNNVDYAHAQAVFKDASGQQLGKQDVVDLSTGNAVVSLPANTQTIDLQLPTIADKINEKTEVMQLSAAIGDQQPVSGTLTVKNQAVDPTVTLSVQALNDTVQQGEFAANSPDITFDYKVSEAYSNMVPPDTDTLMLATSQQRAEYLTSRAAEALAVRAVVSGTSLVNKQGQQVCAFAVANSDEHAPVPSWFEYEQGAAGTWATSANNCSGTPLVINDGYWQQTAADPAKGTKTMELNSRLRFVMQDGVSGWTLERDRFWAGSASGNGKVTFELLFPNKAA